MTMGARRVSGVVRGGVVVPHLGETLPEGAEVTILYTPADSASGPDAPREIGDEPLGPAEAWEREE